MVPLLSSPSTICVTGGAGFIGSWLVARLLAQGHRVNVIDDLSSGVAPPPPHPALRFLRATVLDPAAMAEAAHGATLVFHLAGTVGMRQVAHNVEHSYQVAVEGTRTLLACTPGVPCVLFSSSAVYGHLHAESIGESRAGSDALTLEYDGGVKGYATGKLHLEDLGRGADRPVLCVRPFNVVGPGQVSAWGMVVPSFVDAALAGRPLTVYDDGLQTRSFSEVGRFVETLLRVVAQPTAWQLDDRALNIGNPKATSILDLAGLVLQVTGSRSPVVHQPYKQVFPGRHDVRSRMPDVTRLHDLVGPVAWHGMTEVLQAVLARRRR